MKAIDYLSQAYRLDEQINTKLQQISSLRSTASMVTSGWGGESVSHSRNPNILQDAVCRIMEAEEALNKDIDALVSLKLEINDLISQVHNVTYRLILEKRHLCFMTWEAIAIDLGYSVRWVQIRHTRALEVVQKLLDERESAV